MAGSWPLQRLEAVRPQGRDSSKFTESERQRQRRRQRQRQSVCVCLDVCARACTHVMKHKYAHMQQDTPHDRPGGGGVSPLWRRERGRNLEWAPSFHRAAPFTATDTAAPERDAISAGPMQALTARSVTEVSLKALTARPISARPAYNQTKQGPVVAKARPTSAPSGRESHLVRVLHHIHRIHHIPHK